MINTGCSSGDNTICTDVPISMGGEASASEPVEVFLAALCGCEQVTAIFIARHLKPQVVIDRIDFEVKASRNPLGAIKLPLDGPLLPSRLEKIWGTALVHTSAPQEQVDSIEREVKRRCPLANMVHLSGCELDIKFIKA